MAKSAKKKQGSKRPPSDSSGGGSGTDWLSSLVKKASSTDQPSKAERIERRKAKKQRRDDRTAEKPQAQQRQDQPEQDEQRGESDRKSSRYNLKHLAKHIHTCVVDYDIKKRSISYQSSEPRGKATALAKKDKWTEDTVQPRRRDYGGLGMARPSMWMELNHPSFVPLLQEEFSEHVSGFFGKQRTKAMKKQLDGNMLWRQLAEKRVDTKKLKQSGMNRERLSAMSSDERIEAMIRAGVV